MSEKREMFVKSKLEIRAGAEGKPSDIHGVIPYNSDSEYMGFIEVVRNGAFTKTVKENDIRCLWAHQAHRVVGRNRSDSLRFEDRDDGIHFFCRIPENRSWAMDLVDMIESGDCDGVSFGFRVMKEKWDYDADPVRRYLLEVSLFEVSVGVTFPAYSGAGADVRDIEKFSGFDWDKIAGVMIRSKNLGAENTIQNEEQRKMVKSLIDSLTEIRDADQKDSDQGGAGEDHSDKENDEPSILTQRNQELNLIELSTLD